MPPDGRTRFDAGEAMYEPDELRPGVLTQVALRHEVVGGRASNAVQSVAPAFEEDGQAVSVRGGDHRPAACLEDAHELGDAKAVVRYVFDRVIAHEAVERFVAERKVLEVANDGEQVHPRALSSLARQADGAVSEVERHHGAGRVSERQRDGSHRVRPAAGVEDATVASVEERRHHGNRLRE